MYWRSSRIHDSKSTLSLPRSAHKQVRPGRIRNLRRCQRWYCATSVGIAGRGPTNDMSPFSTLKSCGSSSMENLRSHLPTVVNRGSFLIFITMSFSFRWAT